VIAVLKSVPQEADCSKAKLRIEEEMKTIHTKKDRLLELSMADALTVPEFKKRNGIFNQQLGKLEAQLAAMEAQEAQQKNIAPDWETIHRELEKELTFQEKINTALVATILEKITVKKESSKNEIHLDIFLKLNTRYRAVYHPKKDAASVTSSRNTTHRPLIRRI
jgi:hypothetical protein